MIGISENPPKSKQSLTVFPIKLAVLLAITCTQPQPAVQDRVSIFTEPEASPCPHFLHCHGGVPDGGD